MVQSNRGKGHPAGFRMNHSASWGAPVPVRISGSEKKVIHQFIIIDALRPTCFSFTVNAKQHKASLLSDEPLG